MNILYAPWRQKYHNEDKKIEVSQDECVFCLRIQASDDDQSFILKRNTHSIVILNHYPYNPGHVMVIPFEHVSRLSLLTPAVRAELMDQVSHAEEILISALGAQGLNVGMNIGELGGGGIPSHIHIHVLPRYRGDTTFIETLCETNLISQDLPGMYNRLKLLFSE